MKVLYRVLIIAGVFAGAAPSFAQEGDLDNMLKGSVGDAQKIVGAYIEPFMNSASLSLNHGWYNTAKPHKVAGIDITVSVNAMKIPASDYTYNVSSLGLQQLQLVRSPAGVPTGHAPTLVGVQDGPVFRIANDPTNQQIEFPGGLDIQNSFQLDRIPVPIAHVGIGLIKSTDVKIRFTPALEFGDTRVKLIGFGVMHDVKQWIPGIKLLPFDLSAFVGYTKFNIDTKLDPDNAANADRVGAMQMTATTVQALIGKKFSILSLYGGIGYNFASSNVAIKGAYDIDNDGVEEATERNPVNLDFSTSGPRATIGARLKLLILTIHADYTVQKYSCLTAGVGLSIR